MAENEGRAGDRINVELLGSGSGLPSARRDTTSLLVGWREDWTLVDCPGSIVHRLARRGLEVEELARVVLTHDHVDHLYGLPHLLHALAIRGHTEPLRLYAPGQALDTVRDIVRAHRLDRPSYPPVDGRPVPPEPGFELVGGSSLRIRAAPAEHGRETIAVRVDASGSGFCHSADTRRSEAVAALARGVDLLLHDCGGLHADRELFGDNHASALDAGRTAATAGVSSLVLIHLGREIEISPERVLEEARGAFEGEVQLGRDGMRLVPGESIEPAGAD